MIACPVCPKQIASRSHDERLILVSLGEGGRPVRPAPLKLRPNGAIQIY